MSRRTKGEREALVAEMKSKKSPRNRAPAQREALVAEMKAKRNRGQKRSNHGASVVLPALDGCVLIVSDAHYRPGTPVSRAHRAAVWFAKTYKPFAVVNNGDAADLSRISRWGFSSYESMHAEPTVGEELAEVSVRLEEFEDIPEVQWCTWNLGNHDARFETWLAKHAAQYGEVYGFALKDHFQGWIPAWETIIGEGPDAVHIKHRFKSGAYAARNNALHAGRSYVTGHLHRLYAMPITNLNGTHWGIEAGTLAEIDSKTFHYTELNPVDWQSGFAVLHFQNGKLSGHEFCNAMPDGRVLFRGQDILGVI